MSSIADPLVRRYVNWSTAASGSTMDRDRLDFPSIALAEIKVDEQSLKSGNRFFTPHNISVDVVGATMSIEVAYLPEAWDTESLSLEAGFFRSGPFSWPKGIVVMMGV
jgi:hypothetical protein